MPKTKFTEENWREDPWFRALCAAFLSCKNEEEIAKMFRDIGTLSELQAWSERLEVAKQLSRGLSYRQVAANTGASTTTVTRVARFLEMDGGYRKFLRKQKKGSQSEKSNHQESKPKPGGIQKAGALKKYLG